MRQIERPGLCRRSAIAYFKFTVKFIEFHIHYVSVCKLQLVERLRVTGLAKVLVHLYMLLNINWRSMVEIFLFT